MKAAPAKDKKTIVVVSVFGVLLLVFVVFAYNTFFGGSPNPAATATPVSAPLAKRSNSSAARSESSSNRARGGLGLHQGLRRR
jgi:hypothetical protein